MSGKKHDFRLYLVVFSVDPLIVFLNDEGYVRFCTQDYQQPDDSNANNCFVHLTNYQLNKDSKDFQTSSDILEENTASKKTLTSYWKSLEKMGFDCDQVGLNS